MTTLGKGELDRIRDNEKLDAYSQYQDKRAIHPDCEADMVIRAQFLNINDINSLRKIHVEMKIRLIQYTKKNKI